ncbi:MAG: hypothetical protein J2P38_00465 [Candidatus Dormibacteraeota bacterium]|nr:hypothetical protein [Candidatus Dormibacteraeota bacterium]MBO0701376.1 hypothetical protein [Candidatus Dormibacteraeota bacterium]
MIRLVLRLALTAAVAVAVLQAAGVYGMVTSDSKISPALQHELGDGSYVYSVRVELDFPPEYYHIQKLQQVGTVAGVSGDTVRVLQVTPDQVHELAGLYWVKRLEPIDSSQ